MKCAEMQSTRSKKKIMNYVFVYIITQKKVRTHLGWLGKTGNAYLPFCCLNCLPNNFCKITEKVLCFYLNSVLFPTQWGTQFLASDFKVCSMFQTVSINNFFFFFFTVAGVLCSSIFRKGQHAYRTSKFILLLLYILEY